MKIAFRHNRRYEPINLNWSEMNTLKEILINGFVDMDEDITPLRGINQKLQLKNNGGETIVQLYDGNTMVAKGVARCSEMDAYCKNTGILISTWNLLKFIENTYDKEYYNRVVKFIEESGINNIFSIFNKNFNPNQF